MNSFAEPEVCGFNQRRKRAMVDSRMNILVVDDFSIMRRVIKNILRQLGYINILEADDVTSVMEVLRREKVDFIISDWNICLKCRELNFLRQSEQVRKDMPFLMVTAEGENENVIEAVKNRVNNYVVKPFSPETLMEKINQIFEEK